MISITAGVHGFRRTSRSMSGTHVKAFGTSRVALGCIEEDETLEHNRYFTHKQFSKPQKSLFLISIRKIVAKFSHLLLYFLNAFCPLISLLVNARWTKQEVTQPDSKRIVYKSTSDRLEDKVLLRIFEFCDPNTILRLESCCSRFRFLIQKHCNELPKVQTDQIKLLFDEGEVIIFPIDQRRSPNRFPMPLIEHLGKYIRHLSTLSLFIRGLIPAETIPVLKRLSRYRLSASQIYFLWCEFDIYASEQLKDLFDSNSKTLSDIGFELCSPTNMVSDDLIADNLPKLVSLRVWHEGVTNIYGISDQTLFRLADLFKSNINCPLETLDIAGGNFTVGGVCALIQAWYDHERPQQNEDVKRIQDNMAKSLNISLYRCNFTQNDVIRQLHELHINFKRCLEKGGYRLTLNIT